MKNEDLDNLEVDGYFVALDHTKSLDSTLWLRAAVTPSGGITCVVTRRCPNPPCAGFVPRDGRRKYCSVECADEVQRGQSRKWWRNVGGKRRRERATKVEITT